VAHILRQKGFDAYVIAGGLRSWRRAGLPLEAVPAEDVELLPRFN
jgi:rhodanese-related sulfurtransferase